MNKILVPTDFSDTAYNALKFAGDMALQYDSEIHLVNCYQLPQGNSSVMIDLQDILEQDSKKGLAEQVANFLSEEKYAGLSVVQHSLFGYLNECAQNLIKIEGMDAVVMGTTGAETTSNKYFGSNTSKLMKKLNIPLFIVPSKSKLNFGEIVYSVAEDPSKYSTSSTFVKGLAKKYDSKVHLCNVYKDKDHMPALEDRNGFSHFFEGTNTDVHFIENQDVSEGILECSEVNDCGLIIMVRRHYGFFENLLHKSSTKKMAVYANKPLLVLDEELYHNNK
ncbi:MAG: universal stress protein [Crocinitomicaceae bacterium]|nr:universal stress protein [Crocinitomicaceae bacterium]